MGWWSARVSTTTNNLGSRKAAWIWLVKVPSNYMNRITFRVHVRRKEGRSGMCGRQTHLSMTKSSRFKSDKNYQNLRHPHSNLVTPTTAIGQKKPLRKPTRSKSPCNSGGTRVPRELQHGSLAEGPARDDKHVGGVLNGSNGPEIPIGQVKKLKSQAGESRCRQICGTPVSMVYRRGCFLNGL